MKALVALALSACLGSALAAPTPVSFGNHTNVDVTPTNDGTAFDDVYKSVITLSTSSWVSGSLYTNDPASDPLIDIQSVVFREVGGSTVVNWAPGLVVDNWVDGGYGPETWSLPATLLGAGSWTLEVIGVSYMDKGLGGYDGSLTVPEPVTLSLTLAALGMLGLARRRQA